MTTHNPYMLRAEKRGAIGHGIASEKKVAKSLAARGRPASGAMRGAKGDMERDGWLGEAKCTTKQSLKLELGWLNKISIEALNEGKKPFLTMSFVTENGAAKKSGAWVAVPLETFKELIGSHEIS